MTDVVFNLWFEREYPDLEDTELHIGIYSSEAEARAAIARLSDKPGFRDYAEGFNIYPYTLDSDGWTEGFVSIREGQMIAEGYGPYEDKEESRHFPPIKPWK
jgi:homoserine kinase type II